MSEGIGLPPNSDSSPSNIEKQVGVLIILNDITQLQRLETVRRDFIANVSHELKTPITSIKGSVETLLQEEEMNQILYLLYLSDHWEVILFYCIDACQPSDVLP